MEKIQRERGRERERERGERESKRDMERKKKIINDSENYRPSNLQAFDNC